MDTKEPIKQTYSNRTKGDEELMPTILVDYENVNGSNGLKGADVLRSDDILIIFYSGSCGKLLYAGDQREWMRVSNCKVKREGKECT